jgi:membrane-bound metal-dependent hydrolase YbcI (DUF457 family)
MNSKVVLFFVLSVISLLIALFIFFKWLDFKGLLFLLFGVAAVILFWMGIKESKKGKV